MLRRDAGELLNFTKKENKMNIVKTGTSVRVFDGSVTVGDRLAPGVYSVEESRTGLFLCESAACTETDKVYGNIDRHLEKIVAAYKASPKNLGVILSGDKGIGKTMFTKLLMKRVAADGTPVILVNSNFDGLSDFLGSIDQDCLVVFDEFDKSFSINDSRTVDRTAAQNDLLTLFDGVIPGHKLFTITCNDVDKVSSFFMNRPGRFRYHLRFDYPEEAAVREFLRDKVGTSLRREDEDSVVRFSNLVPQSYDCLTAIAAELSAGETFKSAMEILNIVNVSGDRSFSVVTRLAFGNGRSLDVTLDFEEWFDMFDDSAEANRRRIYTICAYKSDLVSMGIYERSPEDETDGQTNPMVSLGRVSFSVGNVRRFATFRKNAFVLSQGFDVTGQCDEDAENRKILEKIAKVGFRVESVILERSGAKNLRYVL